MIKAFLIFGFAIIFVAGLHIQEEHEGALRGVITIQDRFETYLTRCNNCGDGKFEDSVVIYETSPEDGSANWNVVVPARNKIALRSGNGKYLALCQNCWANSTNPNAVFVNSDTPTGGAVWTLMSFGSNLWGFKGINGKWLAKCHQCVGNSQYEDFAFASVDFPLSDSDAKWIVKTISY